MSKKIILFITLAIALTAVLFGCKPKPSTDIEVTNTLDFDRIEIVEVNIDSLKKTDYHCTSYLLKDSKGVEIPYQISGQSLIFQAVVPANSKAVYVVTKGEPTAFPAKTSARFVPERKDDFAWENDLAAYRMYGPALADENPSNGVDLWLKCTDELILDKFYADELEKGLSYHIDHGQGLDCYKVGHTLGSGGIAPYTSQLWVGNHYDHYKVHETGPLRASFTLVYDSVQVDSTYYKQTIHITTEAGSILNKAVVCVEGEAIPMKLAAGIFLHDVIDTPYTSENIIGYAEQAVSDAGVPAGRNYVGVYIPTSAVESKTEGEHLLLMADYALGDEFVYYFGGGWNNRQFDRDEDWFNALERFKKQKENRLKITIH
jgi:hypothetical protein